jgi:hypothetical protein
MSTVRNWETTLPPSKCIKVTRDEAQIRFALGGDVYFTAPTNRANAILIVQDGWFDIPDFTEFEYYIEKAL